MAWGSNEFGQLGDETLTDRATPVGVAHLLDDTLPPAATGFGREQQSTVEMDWSGLPAACKQPAALGDVRVVSAYAYSYGDAIKGWIADYRLDPKTITADPRGRQKLVRFELRHNAPGFKPRAIDRGTYRASEGMIGRTFWIAQYDGQEPTTFHPKRLAGDGDRLELAVVSDTWMCGALIAGKTSTPIAARMIRDGDTGPPGCSGARAEAARVTTGRW
jgi:hypothetical protein